MGQAILTIEMSSLWKGDELYRRNRMRGEMVGAVVAAAGFRAEKGKWPATLGELGTAGAVKDIYSKDGAEAVRYVVTEKGVRVYSVGPNGVDDGGVNGSAAKKDDIAVGVE